MGLDATSRWRRLAAVRGFVVLAFLLAPRPLPAAQSAQQPVPEARLGDAPYCYVGFVSTGLEGPDPAYRGTGFVVGERVVLSAAHVFYDDERPGWNRSSWNWQPAPSSADFGRAVNRASPRSSRVLAGYAAAVARTSDEATQLEAFNRDTVALIFYRPVNTAGPAPLAYDALSGAGQFSLVGYPAEIGGQTTLWGRMYAHQPAAAATFTREGAATDSEGRPMALFSTTDLLSGGGQSGGPLFQAVNGVWTATAITLARSRDYSLILVRALDAEARTLIEAANADLIVGTAGEVSHYLERVYQPAKIILRSDGSVITWNSETAGNYTLRATRADGTELWRLPEALNPILLAETPDGRILACNYAAGIVKCYQGTDGTFLWQANSDTTANKLAVGKRGECYLYGTNRLTCLSPKGATEWTLANLPGNGNTAEAAPAIGTDGHILVLGGGKLVSVRPDGTIAWEQTDVAPAPNQTINASLAVGPEGQIYIRSVYEFRALSQAGAVLWKRDLPAILQRPTGFTVLPDGRIVLLTHASDQAALFLQPDGAVQRTVSVNNDASRLAVDAAENLYTSGSFSVRCYSPEGMPVWSRTDVNGDIYLGPASLLYVGEFMTSRLAAITTAAGAAPGVWHSAGPPDNARRAPNAPDVAVRIVSPPPNTAVNRGYRLALTVVADGSFPLYYEWRRDGVIVPDQFGATLAIPAATATDAGSYTVTVRNAVSTVTSAAATVTVADAAFGSPLWSTAHKMIGVPSVGPDGTVYALTETNRPEYNGITLVLVAIDPSGNELWRLVLGPGSTMPYYSRGYAPVVGDDGTIFAAGRKMLYAVSPAGALRWSRDVAATSSDDTPYLALAHDGAVYAALDRRLTRFRSDGTQDWSVDFRNFTGLVTSNAQPFVRRDGRILLKPFIQATPDGVFSFINPSRSSSFALIGPYDEAVCLSSDGVEIYRADGQFASRQLQTYLDDPTILTADGNLLMPLRGLRLPFGGSVSQVLALALPDARIVSDLGEGRLLVSNYYQIRVVNNAGTSLQSAAVQPSDGFVLGPNGVAAGGQTLRAYNIGLAPSRGPWPMIGADSRHTWRAPADSEWRPQTPSAPTITLPYELTAGYAATLDARVADGVGPYTYQWQRNGVNVPGANASSLTLTNPTEADSGDYRVILTTGSGITVTGVAQTVAFQTPTAVPAGLYAGTISTVSDGSLYARYALLVQPDRTAELMLAGPLCNVATRSRFTNNGYLALPVPLTGHFAVFNDGRVGLTISGLTSTPVAVSGTTAPNGLPVGFYRGGGLKSRPAYALVLPDGRIWWEHVTGGEITLGPGQLSAEGTIRLENTPYTYMFAVTADGVMRFSRPGAPLHDSLPPFAVVWTERTKQESLVNLSTRGWVSPDWPPLIAGFVIEGQRGVLLRGAGPTLTEHGLAPTDVLAQPQLSFRSAAGATLAEAGRWTGSSAESQLRTAASSVGAFPFAEGSDDAALTQHLAASPYSVLIDGRNGGAGIALAEIYDTAVPGPAGRLVNLSTRGHVGNGDRTLIGGFVIRGQGPLTLLLRAIGTGMRPYLGQSEIRVLSRPVLRLFNAGGTELLANQGSGGSGSYVAATAALVGAFPADLSDSAVVTTLEPGLYTVSVEPNGSLPGLALLEIYEVP